MAHSPQGSRSTRSAASPVQVLSVPKGIPLVVRFLAGYKGLLTHWDRGTVPCLGQGHCPPNRHRRGIIWKGYAPVQHWNEGRRVWVPFVLEITECLEEQLRGRDLRGEVWSLCREPVEGNKAGTVIGTFCSKLDVGKLTEPFEVEPILCRVLHVSSIKLGAANPLPGKVILEPVADEPPQLPPELVPNEDPAAEEERRRVSAEQWKQFRERMKGQASAPRPSSAAEDNHQTNGNGKHQG